MTVRIYSSGGVVVETDGEAAPSGGGGGVNEWVEYTLDFGSAPAVYVDKDFTITDATVTTTSKIAVAKDYTDSEWDWDDAVFTVTPGSGSFVLNCELIPGPGIGTRKIEYQVTN
jgi:hypothetical protein